MLTLALDPGNQCTDTVTVALPIKCSCFWSEAKERRQAVRIHYVVSYA